VEGFWVSTSLVFLSSRGSGMKEAPGVVRAAVIRDAESPVNEAKYLRKILFRERCILIQTAANVAVLLKNAEYV
jgi:hypothetical protein